MDEAHSWFFNNCKALIWSAMEKGKVGLDPSLHDKALYFPNFWSQYIPITRPYTGYWSSTNSLGICKLWTVLPLWQKGPNNLTRPIRFYYCSFKDAGKQYSTWEKGLFVVNTAFQEAKETIHQQSLILRGPFKVIEPVSAGTPSPYGVAEQASVKKWYTQTEHWTTTSSLQGRIKCFNQWKKTGCSQEIVNG